MDDYSKVYISLNDYISGVKDLRSLDEVIKDITRYNEHDVFERVKNRIRIEDDWIKFAEDRMKFVEAAVYENRQFIREDGEVLPIERVKKISRNSVENLARHSDYIEKITAEGDIIPEKLYTVNKDTDYGVYENKFLYLLLVTMLEFINRAHDDIDAFFKKENGSLSFTRKNEFLSDEVTLEIKMSFRGKNREASFTQEEQDKINRIDALKSEVISLLATPLMQVVSKEPIISSSITKTNVLTMNENFSNALELYEYLINYDKETYTSEHHAESMSFKNEFAYPLLALELLAEGYKESLMDDFNKDLFNHESEEREKKIEELNLRLAKSKDENGDPHAYILTLEDKIHLLEDQNGEIKILRAQIDDLESLRKNFKSQNDELKKDIEVLEAELKSLRERLKEYDLSKDEEIKAYEKRLSDKDSELQALKNNLEKAKAQASSMEFEKNEAIARENTLKEKVKNLEAEKNVLTDAYEKRLSDKDKEYEDSMAEYRILKARLEGIDAASGSINVADADISEEAFNELEREYNAFTKYYEDVWKRCKKEIIKEIKRKKG